MGAGESGSSSGRPGTRPLESQQWDGADCTNRRPKGVRVEKRCDEPPFELALEDQLVIEIMALLVRAPLEARQSILATASAFVASEEAALEDERKRQVVRLLSARGFTVGGE